MTNISLQSVYIKDFKSQKELDVDFSDGLTLVKGKNGSGKTTLFEAVYTCLYNRRPNGRSASSGIRIGTKSSEIKVRLKCDNRDYLITRVIGSKAKFTIEVDGFDTLSGTNAKKFIDDLIPNYVIRLSMLQDIDIKELITKAVDVDSIVTLSSDKVKELEVKKHDLEIKLQYISNDISNITFNIDSVKSEISSLKNSIKSLSIDTANSNYDEEYISELVRKTQLLNKRISQEKSKQLQDIDIKIDAIHQQYRKLSSDIAVLKSKQQDFGNVTKLDICPVCKQKVDSKHKSKFSSLIQQLTDKQKPIYDQITNLKDEESKLIKQKTNIYENFDYSYLLKEVELTKEDLQVDISKAMSEIQSAKNNSIQIQQIQGKISILEKQQVERENTLQKK